MDTLMPILLWMIDVALLIALLVVAWFTLASTDLFQAVVLFIAFGLLLSLAWVRLQAPDVALAEAALGAGITGALLLSTLGQLTQRHVTDQDQDESTSHDISTTE
ncbi:MAG: hypothetical protein ETSY1_20580 [Candidatus Entotheonella factor]|uniref:MrpA C-terminal/MbhD domain-containing protein n=1 Tax=Entotheonella factor TaxID=1429438 RepID=W4LJW2_ENTF1|nr:MAG: hypothetical protein ETSY1_20580 [Candidatus Entotheonella factor]